MPKCIFGCGPAVAQFYMDEGCVALPHIKLQDLCMQHIVKRTPLNSCILAIDYTVGHKFTDDYFGRNQ